MADLVDEDLEFRGGTLQLSADNGVENNENNRNTAMENSLLTQNNAQNNVNPSVLSGANSLSSSSTSFAEPRPGPATNVDPSQTVYPRYDIPFSKETIKDFFTFRNGVVEHAIRECITGLLFPEDGEFLGSWLLTEITLWDNEKERIILLTSKVVLTVKYDFIALKQLDFKKTYLSDLDTIVIGELVYPPSSLVPDRNLRGVRLMWNRGQPLPIKTQWNPFSDNVPFITFASHPIYWHKEAATFDERATYDMETFANQLQRAIESLPLSQCCIHRSPIVIQSYVGVASMVHNKASMGFFKVRGKFSF